jgi:hypothetical protein
MHESGASSEHPDDSTAQRGSHHGCVVEGGIMVGTAVGVAVLTIKPFESLFMPHASPQQQLAYGVAAYALAIVAAVPFGLLYKIPEGLPKLFLLSLILGILVGPTLFGSFCLAEAVNQLAGWRLEVDVVIWIVLLLWVVLLVGIVMPIAVVIARRTRGRG